MKSGNLNFLEPSGLLQACNGTDLPLSLHLKFQNFVFFNSLIKYFLNFHLFTYSKWRSTISDVTFNFIFYFIYLLFYFIFSMALQPITGHGLLILDEISRSHTKTHHSRSDSSGRVTSPSQRPLPDNTQHPQQNSMPPAEFEPTIPVSERPHTHALGRAATGTGFQHTYRT